MGSFSDTWHWVLDDFLVALPAKDRAIIKKRHLVMFFRLEFKTCNKCWQERPLTPDFFSRNSKARDGFRNECKDCSKKYRQQNEQRDKLRWQKYWASNKETLKEKMYSRRKASPIDYRQRKQEAMEYLGGKCKCCSLKGPHRIMHFHHIDPSTKEGEWDEMRKWSWKRRKAELDKCHLLCANCHGAVHDGAVIYDEWAGYYWKKSLDSNHASMAESVDALL